MDILVAGALEAYNGNENEYLVNALSFEFCAQGHRADSFILPFMPNAYSIPEQIFALRALSIPQSGMLVTVGYPAFSLRHPNKRSFLFNMAPDIQEYWNSEYGILPSEMSAHLPGGVAAAEKQCLKEAKAIVCASSILARDMVNRGLNASVCYVKDIDTSNSNISSSDMPYIVSECNLQPSCRVELLLDIARVISKEMDIQLKLYVNWANPIYRKALEDAIRSFGCENIQVIDGSASSAEVAGALAYIHTDFQKRRLSGVIPRALEAATPILYADDCGAVAELFKGSPGKTSFSPSKFANAIRNLYSSPGARKLLSGKQSHALNHFSSVEVIAKELIS